MISLFIYGTLAPGRPNEHILKNVKGKWEKAFVKGKLLHQGWGAEMGFPGIVLNDTEEEIEGYIFTSNELFDKWNELDAFEGEEYARIITQARLSNNQVVESYIYSLK